MWLKNDQQKKRNNFEEKTTTTPLGIGKKLVSGHQTLSFTSAIKKRTRATLKLTHIYEGRTAT